MSHAPQQILEICPACQLPNYTMQTVCQRCRHLLIEADAQAVDDNSAESWPLNNQASEQIVPPLSLATIPPLPPTSGRGGIVKWLHKNYAKLKQFIHTHFKRVSIFSLMLLISFIAFYVYFYAMLYQPKETIAQEQNVLSDELSETIDPSASVREGSVSRIIKRLKDEPANQDFALRFYLAHLEELIKIRHEDAVYNATVVISALKLEIIRKYHAKLKIAYSSIIDLAQWDYPEQWKKTSELYKEIESRLEKNTDISPITSTVVLEPDITIEELKTFYLTVKEKTEDLRISATANPFFTRNPVHINTCPFINIFKIENSPRDQQVYKTINEHLKEMVGKDIVTIVHFLEYSRKTLGEQFVNQNPIDISDIPKPLP